MPAASAAAQHVLEPADVDAVELGGRRQDLDQGRGVEHGVAAGRGLLEARPVGDVPRGELDARREALARRRRPHQEAQLVPPRELGDDAAAQEAGRRR